MPLYTYQCSNCGVRFDKEQSFNERNPVRCPECQKNTLHRVYRPVGVIFKGSGFYSTDNRSSRSTITTSDSKDGGTKDKETGTSGTDEPKSSSAKSEKSAPAKD